MAVLWPGKFQTVVHLHKGSQAGTKSTEEMLRQ